jgi:hypothetical protein
MAPPIKTGSALSSLPGYFQMHQPRAADMQPSPPGSSGFSSPSATESAFHVLASNPPDVTKSATFSTPTQPRPIAYATPLGNPDPLRNVGPSQSSTIDLRQGRKPTPPSRSSTQPSTQPAYTSAGDNVPKGGKGGTGFTSFNQYFGANAPAAQKVAQTEARKTGQAIEAQANMLAAPGMAYNYGQAYDATQRGLDQFRAGQGSVNAAPQQASSAGAFDAMLAARANPQAAAAEQQRLNQLSNYFAEQQSRAAQQEAEPGSLAEQQAQDAAYRAKVAAEEQAARNQYYADQQAYKDQLEQSGYTNDYENAGQDEYLD